jgi:dTDP-glucose 4,6-dehydratase/UDP-glucuronate decarboxylase
MPFSRVVAEDVELLLHDLRDVLPRFAGTTLLVTGASGFLMSYIVDVVMAWNETADRPCHVLALDNLSTGLPDRLAHHDGSPHLRFIKHDIAQPLELDEPVHWIVHGASIASPTVYRQFPLETIDANVSGTRHMLDLAEKQGVRGIIVMSTSEIYGDPEPAMIPTPEDYRGNVSCTGPRACYDEGKRMAETLAMTYFRLHGTPVKLIRPFNVYGPGLRLDDKRVLPDFMTQVLNDRPIVMLSNGGPTRAFCYISDAIALMIRVLASDISGEPFNTGNDEREISMADLAGTVAKVGAQVLDRTPVEVEFKVSRDEDYLVDNPERRLADLSKARGQFPDWNPRVTLEEGLERTFRHHLEKQRIPAPMEA